MSILSAIGVLVLILVVLDLALTVGIIRRLRANPTAAAEPPRSTPVGLQIDLGRDAAPWPQRAAGMLDGPALVAFVLPGCMGCERLHRQVTAAGDLPVPFYVITDPEAGGDDDYLAAWNADAQLIAPVPADELASFDRPSVFPTVTLLSDGIVVASGHSLPDVEAAMRRLVGRRSATTSAASSSKAG